MIRLCIVTFLLVLASAVSAETVIHGIRTGESAGHTRVVIDLSAKPEWNLFVLDRPYRVVVDIADAGWKLNARPDPPRGLITSLRYGRFATDTGRLVLESADATVAARQFVLPPQAGHGHRLVIDLRPADETQFAAARAATQPPSRLLAAVQQDGAARPAGSPPEPPSRQLRVRTVVIDPGHGGADPGALGRGRTKEKDVVLAVGRVLRQALQKTGRYRVVMTRATDKFIPLRQRVRIARKAGADLFVSLHADAAAGRTVHGAGIYTLSETASDREAAALARRENQSDIIAGVDLSQNADEVTNLILIDLVQRRTMNDSARFARVAVREIGKTISLRRNPHRFAGFRVLRAPDVPSVLVELGFLSNAAEEKKLRSADWQRRVAAAIVTAVDAYFTSGR
jgi:N-acetylmuramoyl-L-alanine amidase